jgi:hypothetical protein
MLHKTNLLYTVIWTFLIVWFQPAQASDFQIRGFGDLVGSQTGTYYPLNSIGNIGQRVVVDPESRLGLNLSADLENNFTFSSLILGEGNSRGNYSLAVNWFFLTYRPNDEFAFRVGRQVNPVYLYSEQIDVGYIYPWVRRPAEVYSIDPLESFFGLSAIYTLLKDNLQWRIQIFGGAGNFTLPISNGSYSGSLENDKGIDLSLSSDHFKIRLGYDSVDPTLTAAVSVPIPAAGPINGTLNIPISVGSVQIFSAGAKVEYDKFMAMAEEIRLISNGDLIRHSTGAYGTLGYHLSDSWMPYATYAWKGNLSGSAYVFPDSTVSMTPETDQHSVMMGVNYRATTSVVVKAEYMRTQEYFIDQTKNFGANTYSASVDFVF